MADFTMSTVLGRLSLYAGFFMALGSKMEWKPRADVPGGVAATDARTVWYHPDLCTTRPMGEVVFIALHEIMHPMLLHMNRIGGRDRKIANIAMDIAGNQLLAKVIGEYPSLKATVPEDACLHTTFGFPPDLTWEAYYNMLVQNCKGGKTVNGVSLKQFDDLQDGTNPDGTPRSEAEAEGLRKEWMLHVQQSALTARRYGKLPGCMEELIGEMIKPKVNWREQLRDCVMRTARDESSYRRFNRRFLGQRVYLPGYYSERIGRIAYFCDTSGSISSDEFKMGMGAMTDILEDLKPDAIMFGQCDTTLHSVQELTPDDLPLPPLKVHGRGGTDMREAFEWACANEHDIDAFVLQTDGYIPPLDPSLHPNIPVIWLLTTDAQLPAGCDVGTQVRVTV